MNLKALKVTADQYITSAHSTVQNYVAELESSVKANKVWLISTAIICLIVGAYLGHLLPHK